MFAEVSGEEYDSVVNHLLEDEKLKTHLYGKCGFVFAVVNQKPYVAIGMHEGEQFTTEIVRITSVKLAQLALDKGTCAKSLFFNVLLPFTQQAQSQNSGLLEFFEKKAEASLDSDVEWFINQVDKWRKVREIENQLRQPPYDPLNN